MKQEHNLRNPARQLPVWQQRQISRRKYGMDTQVNLPYSLTHGDCLTHLATIPDGSVHLIVFDPPYQVTDAKWDKLLDHAKVMAEFERVLTKHGTVVAFGSDGFSFKLHAAMAQYAPSIEYRYSTIWLKTRGTTFFHAKNRANKIHEDVMIFSRGLVGHYGTGCGKTLKRMTYNPQGLTKLDQPVNYGPAKPRPADGVIRGSLDGAGRKINNANSDKIADRTHEDYPTTVYDYASTTNRKEKHSTAKPDDLLEELVRTFSNPDELVLDVCFGGGSTGVGCMRSGRRFSGAERLEKFFEMGKARIEAVQQAQ